MAGRFSRSLVIVGLGLGLGLGGVARAQKGGVGGEQWLEGLHARVAADVKAGRPLVVQAHVALCDNGTIRCGGHGLGDGDDLDRNLYWATSGGTRGWLSRRGSGWTLVHRERGKAGTAEQVTPGVLAIDVWKRRFSPEPGSALHRHGVTRPFDVYLVAYAWRGAAIDDAVNAYTRDLFGSQPRTVKLDDKTMLQAGGAAQVVAWIGHDRWMDYDAFDWQTPRTWTATDAPPKGTIAVACQTWQYLGAGVASPQRVPLLLLRDFCFAGTHAFEGAVSAFASGASLSAIRRAGATSYATGQGKLVGRVDYAFTNPADPRWR